MNCGYYCVWKGCTYVPCEKNNKNEECIFVYACDDSKQNGDDKKWTKKEHSESPKRIRSV
jgi:hypothetical protein